MNKICTSVEQSKKLKELGIDVNSADMHWQYIEEDNGQLQWFYFPKDFSINENESIPAWSLDTLLRIPLTINVDNDENYINTSSQIGLYEVKYMNVWDGEIHSTYSNECLLDSAFEMVCWLKENEKI